MLFVYFVCLEMEFTNANTDNGYDNSYGGSKYNRFKKRKKKPFKCNGSTGVSVRNTFSYW